MMDGPNHRAGFAFEHPEAGESGLQTRRTAQPEGLRPREIERQILTHIFAFSLLSIAASPGPV